MSKRGHLFLAGALYLVGCRHVDDAASVKFIELGPDKVGLSAKMLAPVLRICLAQNATRWGPDAKRALLAWVAAAQEATTLPLTRRVEIETAGASGACVGRTHVSINLITDEGRAHAYPLERPAIYVFQNSTSQTLLHEFGHAFGLGDTYVEGVWNCKPGQPIAVMCHSQFDELQDDDRRGIQSITKRLYRQLEARAPIPAGVCVQYDRSELAFKINCVDAALNPPTTAIPINASNCTDAKGPDLFGDDWSADDHRAVYFASAANCSDASIPEKGTDAASPPSPGRTPDPVPPPVADPGPAAQDADGVCVLYTGGASAVRLGRINCVSASASNCNAANERTLFERVSTALKKSIVFYAGGDCNDVPDFVPAR